MPETITPDAPAVVETPQGGSTSGLPFQNATKDSFTITSRLGKPVEQNSPPTTPTLEDPNPTNAIPPVLNNNATPPVVPDAPPIVEGAPQTPPSDTPPVDGPPQSDINTLLSAQSGGKILKLEDALSAMEERDNLKIQLAERPKIEFPSEQAKQLYEYASKFPGLEMKAAQGFLHVQSLGDIKALGAKEVQFEAFAIKRKDLTREEARQYFDEKYEKNYGSDILETSVAAKLDHRAETQQSQEILLKMQEDFVKAQPSQQAAGQIPQLSEEDKQTIQRNVEALTKDFGGVKFQFVKDDPSSTVNIPLDKAQLQKFQSYLADPGNIINDLVKECSDNGVFNQKLFADTVFEIMNRKRVKEQSFMSGKVYGELAKIKEMKNTAPPKPQGSMPPAQAPQTYKDAMREGIKASRSGVRV